MSKLRSINTHFWQDNYIIDLDPIEKLLFLYLLSNQQTNMLGIYELHIRRISFDTGIDKDMVLKIFERFTRANKVKYIDGYVVLQNFLRHQSFNPNMETSAIKTWNELPLKVREDTFCEPILKGLKGFAKASEPIAEIEYELEMELEDENERENGKIVYLVDDIENIECKHTLLAIHIWKDVDDLRPKNKTTQGAKVKSWKEPIRLMVEQDERTHEEIWQLWKRVQRDEFWRTNILSTSKLREKFDQLSIKLQPNGKNHARFVDKLFP